MLTASCHCGAVRVEIPRRPPPKAKSRIGVNARSPDRKIFESIRVRHLDGASTWKWLD